MILFFSRYRAHLPLFVYALAALGMVALFGSQAAGLLVAPILMPMRAQRLTSIVRALMDTRGIPANLTFLNRTPVQPADDDEILGEFQGNVYIADIVADDGKAVVRNSGRIVPLARAVPNIKHGTNLTQRQLNDISDLGRRGGEVTTDDLGLAAWETRLLDNLRVGVMQRMEHLLVAMYCDGLGFNYNRQGIQMAGVNWRMPAPLKVTAAVAITNVATATPVTVISNVMLQGTVYGAMYDRITMSTALFRAMIATDEFKARAALFLPQTITYANLVTANLTQQRVIAANVLGLAIELYDARYTVQNADGTESSAPYLPLGLAVLSSTVNDNDGTVMSFGNSVVTESIVADLTDNTIIGSFGGEQYGPVGYATGDHNPPTVTFWSAARGFPIKRQRAATAVIDFGAVTDPITFVAYP